MSNIIQLDHYKKKKLAQTGFKVWNAQFRQTFDETTRICDLPDNVILFLSSPGDKSAGAIYQLIEQIKFPSSTSVDNKAQSRIEMELMDIHLYLVDKFRFEMMSRLGWIEDYTGMNNTLLELILEYEQTSIGNFEHPPQLTEDHPRLSEYNELINREKELFIRKLFVNALIEFNHKLHD